MEKRSNSFGKNVKKWNFKYWKDCVAEEKSETGTGNMARRRSLPAVNILTLERLQQQDPAQGIENFLFSIDSNPEVGHSFDRITKRSRKQTEKGLAYSLQVLFEKKIAL